MCIDASTHQITAKFMPMALAYAERMSKKSGIAITHLGRHFIKIGCPITENKTNT